MCNFDSCTPFLIYGKEIFTNARFCEECGRKPVSKPMLYTSVVLAVLGVILPFLNWLEVPVAKSLHSLFGMEDQTPAFSLFGYIFAGNQYQDGVAFVITTAIALIAFVSVIFNIVYIITALTNKPKNHKYGTAGSIILMIVSILFIVFVGLMCLIFKIFKLTSMPYITLAVSIVNVIIIKKLKKSAA